MHQYHMTFNDGYRAGLLHAKMMQSGASFNGTSSSEESSNITGDSDDFLLQQFKESDKAESRSEEISKVTSEFQAEIKELTFQIKKNDKRIKLLEAKDVRIEKLMEHEKSQRVNLEKRLDKEIRRRQAVEEELAKQKKLNSSQQQVFVALARAVNVAGKHTKDPKAIKALRKYIKNRANVALEERHGQPYQAGIYLPGEVIDRNGKLL